VSSRDEMRRRDVLVRERSGGPAAGRIVERSRGASVDSGFILLQINIGDAQCRNQASLQRHTLGQETFKIN
jgi:hypothetical protein